MPLNEEQKIEPERRYPIYLTSKQIAFFMAVIEMLPNKESYPLSRKGITDISEQLMMYYDIWKKKN